MASSLDVLQDKLGNDYSKLFSLILTDRGSEFEKYNLFETNTSTGEFRGNIFYCGTQTPSQKPNAENNHNYVRDIVPNKKSIKHLTQGDIDLMFSHIIGKWNLILHEKKFICHLSVCHAIFLGFMI